MDTFQQFHKKGNEWVSPLAQADHVSDSEALVDEQNIFIYVDLLFVYYF